MSERLTIPEIRDALIEEVEKLEAAAKRIRHLEAQMWRRIAVRRAGRKSRRTTGQVLAEIKLHAHEHPDKTYMEIAHLFNVSLGRVSEALAGKR